VTTAVSSTMASSLAMDFRPAIGILSVFQAQPRV
jgi:hypothetical protein